MGILKPFGYLYYYTGWSVIHGRVFWYLGKSVHIYSSILWISCILKGTRKTRPCLSGLPVSVASSRLYPVVQSFYICNYSNLYVTSLVWRETELPEVRTKINWVLSFDFDSELFKCWNWPLWHIIRKLINCTCSFVRKPVFSLFIFLPYILYIDAAWNG